jgi:flap endonuclease-1
MGIKNFKKFITSKIENPIHKAKFDDLNIKSICIDINIFIYKFITAIRRTGKDLEHNGKITSHIIGLRNQINLFQKLGIDMIYVFDGTPPKEKNKILKERENIKKEAKKEYNKTQSIKSYQQSFFITDEIIDSAREYLKLRGVKYIDEDIEADIICASLVKQRIVDCVYTTDFDVLAYGAKCMIINIDYQKKYFEYILLKDILKGLNITYSQFLDIVVLSGCDYCDKVENMTLNKAYKYVNENNKVSLNKNLKKAKDIFMLNIKIKKNLIIDNKFNTKGLKKFLSEHGLKS